MPEENNNPRQNGVQYFQEHFAGKLEQIKRDIDLILAANPNFKKGAFSLDEPLYFFTIETACTADEIAAIKARDIAVMKKLPAVATMTFIVKSY